MHFVLQFVTEPMWKNKKQKRREKIKMSRNLVFILGTRYGRGIPPIQICLVQLAHVMRLFYAMNSIYF